MGVVGIHRNKYCITVDLPEESMVECRKQLFKQGVSIQGFFTQVLRLVERNDEMARKIYELAKEEAVKKAQQQRENGEPPSSGARAVNVLYNMLEKQMPLK